MAEARNENGKSNTYATAACAITGTDAFGVNVIQS